MSDRQPLLHDRCVSFAAPSQVWCSPDGRIDSARHGIDGVFHGDTRVLDLLTLHIGGAEPEQLALAQQDSSVTMFTGLVRGVDDESADPRIRVQQVRRIQPGELTEQIVLENGLAEPVATTVRVTARVGFAAMQEVKAGSARTESADRVEIADSCLMLGSTTVRARLAAPDAEVAVSAGIVTLDWDVTVAPRSSSALHWSLTMSDEAAVVGPAAPSAAWSRFSAETGDSRMAAWLHQALADLQGLRMTTISDPGEVFLGAGAPWFFTLFGRDSIWAARMMLPLGTETAASTLRVLAGLQGRVVDPDTAEQPGKIVHEVRAVELAIPGEGITLPPRYYGTIDATPLWIVLLHEAWKWGMPGAEVGDLVPNLEAALAWMRDFGDSDGDGFLEYADLSGRGLANQGWKDSGDSIQWRDGRLADGPIALCEVQAYAYQAAVCGAEILDAFDRPGGEGWRDWAAALKARFAESFWIDDADGAYPAIALDAAKRRVDTVTSNLGHLLGTGLLDREQAGLVARRLVSPELASGYGLRTMATESAGYWPLSYHGGSVWAHDTAIAITGLAREGFVAEADQLAEGLLRAAEGFGYRMPELHSGDSSAVTAVPIPYPAACRPQAWSAAAAFAVLTARLGLAADASRSRLDIRPTPGAGPLRIGGLQFQGETFTVTVGADHVAVRSPSE